VKHHKLNLISGGNSMKKSIIQVVALAVVLLLAACSSSKGPAEQAIQAAEAAYDSVKVEALKYVPDQAQAVETALNAAKESFAKGDYLAALNSAKDLAPKAKDLATAVAAKKEELTKNWSEMSAGLPKMVEAIKSRVDILSKSKKLPAGLDKVKFDGVKSGLAEITQTWTDATTAFQSGNLAEALAKAKTVKDKAVEIMTTLGMHAPTAAKG
jgi:hypothetical protein